MTDNEIVKALECCSQNNGCEDCPYSGIGHCTEKLPEDALNLINCQKAENEKLQDLMVKNDAMIAKQEVEIERLKGEPHYFVPARGCCKTLYVRHKIESIEHKAIKEFAERLKEHREIVGYDRDLELDIYGSHIHIDIDEFNNILKEMVGDSK